MCCGEQYVTKPVPVTLDCLPAPFSLLRLALGVSAAFSPVVRYQEFRFSWNRATHAASFHMYPLSPLPPWDFCSEPHWFSPRKHRRGMTLLFLTSFFLAFETQGNFTTIKRYFLKSSGQTSTPLECLSTLPPFPSCGLNVPHQEYLNSQQRIPNGLSVNLSRLPPFLMKWCCVQRHSSMPLHFLILTPAWYSVALLPFESQRDPKILWILVMNFLSVYANSSWFPVTWV